MDKLIEAVNSATDNKYNYLRLNKLDIFSGAKKAIVSLLVPGHIFDKEFTDSVREEIIRAVRTQIPDSFTTEVIFKKAYIDTEVLKSAVINCLTEFHPSASTQIKEDDIKAEEDDDYLITINCPANIHNYLNETRFIEKLDSYLSRNFCNDFDYRLTVKSDNQPSKEFGYDNREVSIIIPDEIIVSDLRQIIGKPIKKYPKFIRNSFRDITFAVICGKINNLAKKVSKNGNEFYSFSLDDTTERMLCLYFSKTAKVTLSESLRDGDEVVLAGSVKADSGNRGFTFWVNDICACVIDWDTTKDNTVYKGESKNYMTIEPRPYIISEQMNLLEETVNSEYLKDKDFVIFDLETTGIDTEARIIEIAAIKIRNGEMIEEFSTFVNPCINISAEITKLTGICDADVADAPRINEVIGDFYKFTRGATLVAHNTPFDMAYIKREGKANKYNFFEDNTMDTLELARKYVSGVHNYKLITLCEHFKINLEGAHRAINDVLATAKLFNILSRKIS